MAQLVRVRRLSDAEGQKLQRIVRRGSTNPDKDAKLDRIEHALHERPDRTFAFDEFGPLGIRPTAGACWARQGKPDRLPATFHRTHGVRYST
ncbi:Transposase OS=Streptomyces aurantiogriseus OX=66870 GN=GCM10010251_26640 PE=4 SV=1 [Streptomyces aurantiogriseus]|uniref:Transposase n=1 Tax=Streptomyces aurantiogriseus TaxID=66870 RepID=A0A918F528_9ACTN|nr:hypothetical protein GCM10010251_26640 [Streptomyces aurantiogriseus]